MEIEYKTVTLSQEALRELLEDVRFLRCLERAGVDNWDGYDFACEEFHEKQN